MMRIVSNVMKSNVCAYAFVNDEHMRSFGRLVAENMIEFYNSRTNLYGMTQSGIEIPTKHFLDEDVDFVAERSQLRLNSCLPPPSVLFAITAITIAPGEYFHDIHQMNKKCIRGISNCFNNKMGMSISDIEIRILLDNTWDVSNNTVTEIISRIANEWSARNMPYEFPSKRQRLE